MCCLQLNTNRGAVSKTINQCGEARAGTQCRYCYKTQPGIHLPFTRTYTPSRLAPPTLHCPSLSAPDLQLALFVSSRSRCRARRGRGAAHPTGSPWSGSSTSLSPGWRGRVPTTATPGPRRRRIMALKRGSRPPPAPV